MSVYQRGKCGTWYYSFHIKRKPYFGRCLEATNAEEARNFETIKRAEVLQGLHRKQEVGGEDFGEFVDSVYMEYSRKHKTSWKHDEFRCEMLKGYFAGMKFKDFTPKHVEQFVLDRLGTKTKQKTDRSDTTVYKEFQVLSAIFNTAEVEGIAVSNPCRKIRKQIRRRLKAWNKRERYLTAEELPRLLEVLTEPREHIRQIVILALQTGMRKGALLDLMWEHVNLTSFTTFVKVKNRPIAVEPNRLLVVRNKLGPPYTVPLNRVARALLLNLKLDATNTDFVFKSIVTGLKVTDVRRAFKSACRLAQINGLTFHDLRHTFSTWAGVCGVPEHVRGSLLGHASQSITDSYTHSTSEIQRNAVERVADYFDTHSYSKNYSKPSEEEVCAA